MDWTAPIFKEIATIFKQNLETLNIPISIIETGIILCQKKQKWIPNPNLYIAAIHYLLSTIAPLEKVYTHKVLAKLYGVSFQSISSVYSDLGMELSPEITELMVIVYGSEEAPPLFNKFVLNYLTGKNACLLIHLKITALAMKANRWSISICICERRLHWDSGLVEK